MHSVPKNTAYHAEKIDIIPFFKPLSIFSNRSVELNFLSRFLAEASTEKSR
jgi:hypothetical protein